MLLEPNEKGKYILIDQDGEEVIFDYGVDAREALNLVDEDGEKRYYTHEEKPKFIKRKEIVDPDPQSEEEEEQTSKKKGPGTAKREVKTLGKKRKKK